MISVQESQLTQRSLHISNRVDFQLADHDGFDRYMESWQGIQSSSPSANTFIDFLNEDDEIVLRLHFKNDDLEVQSDYSATPPPFSFQTNAVHQITVIITVRGTNGSTSYADITVSEAVGDGQEWGQMPLLGTQLETLETIRFRSADNSPYTLDNLAAHAN